MDERSERKRGERGECAREAGRERESNRWKERCGR
jgi:hypothetical protein